MSRDKKRLLTSSYEKGTLYELADAMVECFATGLKSGQPTYSACYRPEVVDAVCDALGATEGPEADALRAYLEGTLPELWDVYGKVEPKW